MHTLVERMRDERSCTTCSVAHRELASPVELAKTTASLRARSLSEGRGKNFYPLLIVGTSGRESGGNRSCLPPPLACVGVCGSCQLRHACVSVGMHFLPASSRVRLHRARASFLSCLMCLQVYVGNPAGKTLYTVRSHLSALASVLLHFT